jgi:WD40 repeat protein
MRFSIRFGCVVLLMFSGRIQRGGLIGPERNTVWRIREAADCSVRSLLQYAMTRVDAVGWHHESRVASLAFSPNGKFIATGSHDKLVRIWAVATGKEVCRFPTKAGVITAIVFSPDGKFIADNGDVDEGIRVWEVKGPKQKHLLRGHTGWVRALAWASSGNMLASASEDGTVRLWDTDKGKELRCLRGHKSKVRSVTFSPRGTMLATAGDDQTVRLWDVPSGKEVRSLRGHEEMIWSVAFAPDGKTLASGSSDGTLRLWDVRTGTVVRLLRWKSQIVSVAFSPDGRVLAGGNDVPSVRLWSMVSGKPLHDLLTRPIPGGFCEFAFSPNGKVLAVAASSNELLLFNPFTGRRIRLPIDKNDLDP